MSKLKFDEGKIWGVFSEKLNILKMVEEEGLDSCFKDGGSVKEIKEHFSFLINNELNSSQKSLKQHLTFEEQLMFPKNIDILLPKFQTAFFKIL